jgi:hypothetical protein
MSNLNIYTIINRLVDLRQDSRTIIEFTSELEFLVTSMSNHYDFLDTQNFLYNQFILGVDMYYREAIDEFFIDSYSECKSFCLLLEQNLNNPSSL